MSPGAVETPLSTAWPAFVALGMLLGGLALGGRRLLPPRRAGLALLAVLALAVVVRLWVVPAWSRHAYDGHEAEYWDLFRGERALSRGGTVLYPAMQWLWWGLGRVLPHHPQVPVLVSTLFGVGAVAAVGLTVGRLCGRGWAGVLAAALVAVHPVHAAWSSSAYNVVPPQLFGGLALAATAALLRPDGPLSRREQLGLGAVVGGGLALAIATRLESGLLVLPVAALLLGLWGEGTPGPRARLLVLAPVLVGGLLAALAARPLLFPGELPGAGERGAAFAVNVDLLAYHAPFDAAPALALVAGGAALAARRWPVPTLALVGTAVANHLLMASFDDYGDRHALTGLWGVAWALAAGAAAVPPRAGRLGPALAAGGLLVAASGLPELRRTYYGAEEAYAETLREGELAGLPRHPADRVATVVAPPGRCGWVAEDHRVARDPPLSHFNLLDPAEAASLRGPDGCLRWCADVQDWRWSSRGVRDRAARLHHLYALQPVAVVEEPESGFACVVWQVGARRR